MNSAVIHTTGELRALLGAQRQEGRSVGFAPTMGALHAGHASLFRQAASQCDVVVGSVFVNPLQFGEGEDFDQYPRTLERDTEVFLEAGGRWLYAPAADEIYPEGFATQVQVSAALTNKLCGASRPGHFDGVTTVVMKLLQIVAPDIAYFGAKDWQQYAVLRRMARDLDLACSVVACPIVRESDGLAMSSRNAYLSEDERAVAPALYRALRAADESFRQGERRVAALLAFAREQLASGGPFTLEYLSLHAPYDLADREEEAQAGDVLAIAARLPSARLIDNLRLGEDEA